MQVLQLLEASADGAVPRATTLAAADWLLALCSSAALDEEAAAATAGAAAAGAAASGAVGGVASSAASNAAGGAAGGAAWLGQAQGGDLATVRKADPSSGFGFELGTVLGLRMEVRVGL